MTKQTENQLMFFIDYFILCGRRAGRLAWFGHPEGPEAALTRLRSQVQVLPGPPSRSGDALTNVKIQVFCCTDP